MDNILNHIAIKNLINNPSLNDYFYPSSASLNSIPNNCFGVFVTVKRSSIDKEITTDIHGCIGYWNKDFSEISKENLFEKIQSVGYSAFNTDSRKEQFDIITKDPNAIIEISFMMLPIYTINEENGAIIKNESRKANREANNKANNKANTNSTFFSNEEYGLIVYYGNKKATYLPKVFENTNWKTIKERLIRKADSRENENNAIPRFFAYKTLVYEMCLHEIMKTMKPIIISNFLSFNQKYYSDFVPYEYHKTKNMISIDKQQYVRNNATMYDILRSINYVKKLYTKKNTNTKKNRFTKKNTNTKKNRFTKKNTKYEKILNKIYKNSQYYYNIFIDEKERINESMRQAAAFLLLTLSYKNQVLGGFNTNTNLNTNKIGVICDYLINELEKGVLEPEFERGEIMIAINNSCRHKENLNGIMIKHINNIYNELKEMNSSTSNIFRLNWEAKTLHAFFSNKREKNTKTKTNMEIKTIASKILELVIEYIETQNISKKNTNYLAVSFEALSSLIFILDDSKAKAKVKVKAKAKDLQFYCFCLLQKYYDPSIGLYYFKDNNTARLDITGHVISGLLAIH